MNLIYRKRVSEARIEVVRNLGSPLFQAFFGTLLPGKAFFDCIKDGKNIEKNRYQAMITQHAWMFLSSFEKLREKLLQKDTVNMAHLGARAFEEIGGEVVQTTSFVLRGSHIAGCKGVYCRLVEPTTQNGKEHMFLAGKNRYESAQDNFEKIPGSPIAYWVSIKFISNFDKPSIGTNYIPKFGMSTGDGDRFIRNWYEVSLGDFRVSLKSEEEANKTDLKWVAVDKGGSYRKWYGNRNCVVWWKRNGEDIKCYPKSAVRSPQFFFRKHISWTLISSGHFSARYFDNGFALDTASNCVYSNTDSFDYLIGLLNSKVADNYLSVLNPTMNFSCGVISLIPCIIHHGSDIERVSKDNINLSTLDWDSFETSWDFKQHPLI
jgi:hypothetical protein